MRPGALPSSGGGSHTWDFPNPFLYGGIFLVLATIAVSLVALACSHWRSSSSSNKDSSDSSSVKGQPSLLPLEMEPRIVIMAGNKEATFLAKPLHSSYRLYAQASPEPTNRPQV